MRVPADHRPRRLRRGFSPEGRGDRRGLGDRLRRRAAPARFDPRPAPAARLSAAARTELFADAASAVSAVSGATGLSAQQQAYPPQQQAYPAQPYPAPQPYPSQGGRISRPGNRRTDRCRSMRRASRRPNPTRPKMSPISPRRARSPIRSARPPMARRTGRTCARRAIRRRRSNPIRRDHIRRARIHRSHTRRSPTRRSRQSRCRSAASACRSRPARSRCSRPRRSHARSCPRSTPGSRAACSPPR